MTTKKAHLKSAVTICTEYGQDFHLSQQEAFIEANNDEFMLDNVQFFVEFYGSNTEEIAHEKGKNEEVRDAESGVFGVSRKP